MEKPGAQSAAPLLHPQPPPPLHPYYGVPAYEDDSRPAYVLLLPVNALRCRLRRLRRHPCRCCCSVLSSSSLLTAFFFSVVLFACLFFIWPADPDLSIVRLHLDRIHVNTSPTPSLDISLGLEIRVHNRDFFSLDYDSIVVSIGYRGRKLGSIHSKGGHVRARGKSYVDAQLHLDGIQVLSDAFYLIEDLARGSIPFDTITKVEGQLHLFFLDVPIAGRMSCSVHVNPDDQTVIRQDCYP